MFEKNSRYASLAQYQVTDRRGRLVTVVETPEAPGQALLGLHVWKQGQRLDHLAYQYLNEATAFWRICEINDAMLPEALSEKDEIAIPVKSN
jgi:hypothetical protein